MRTTPDNLTKSVPSKWIDPLAVIIWLIPLTYLLVSYPSLPATVPMHFDGNGRPDGFGTKLTHLLVMLGMWIFNIGIYLVVRNVHRLDPKATVRLGVRTYRNLALAILLFLSALHVMIVYATVEGGLVIDRMLFVLLGGLFGYLGWIMKDIEPNYFIGIRTPWTLEDPENWKATHAFAGRWFLWGAAFVVIAAVLLPRPYELYASIGVILLITIVPIVYSYRFFAARRN